MTLRIVLAVAFSLACRAQSPQAAQQDYGCSKVNQQLDASADVTVKWLRAALECVIRGDNDCFVSTVRTATSAKLLHNEERRLLEICYEKGRFGESVAVLQWETDRTRRINSASIDLTEAMGRFQSDPSAETLRAFNEWRDAL